MSPNLQRDHETLGAFLADIDGGSLPPIPIPAPVIPNDSASVLQARLERQTALLQRNQRASCKRCDERASAHVPGFAIPSNTHERASGTYTSARKIQPNIFSCWRTVHAWTGILCDLPCLQLVVGLAATMAYQRRNASAFRMC